MRARLVFPRFSGILRRLRGFLLKRAGLVRPGLAVIAGLLWAGAFPTTGLAGLAWIAPATMLLAAWGTGTRQAFRLGYLAGAVHCLISIHWLLYNPFPLGALAGWLILSAYLALYPAVWVALAWKLFPKHANLPAAPGMDGATGPPPSPGRGWEGLSRFASASWAQRVVWCATGAALWVGLEMLQSRLLTGFPWNLLGASQYTILPVTQIAHATGVYGVSFLVAWGSLAILCAVLKLVVRLRASESVFAAPFGKMRPRQPLHTPLTSALLVSFRLSMFSDLALPLVAFGCVMFYGSWRLVQPQRYDREIRIALIQPSIPQKLIFDSKEAGNRYRTLIELSQLALAAKPDLLVWPEASLPDLDEEQYQSLTNLIGNHRVWMVLGGDDVRTAVLEGGAEATNSFNAAFLFAPNGRCVNVYHKCHLVMFGEYIPFERWMPLIKYLTPVTGSFTPGDGPSPFEVSPPSARASVLICFEDIFPHLARKYVDDSTDFLLNLTNDGWFGESAAQWQHAAAAVFRAIENDVPLVRCGNNGLTCWVDSRGRLRDAGFREAKDVYGPGFKTVVIPLRARDTTHRPTFYRRHGDMFGWLCLLWAASAVLIAAMAWSWGNTPAMLKSPRRS